MTTQKKIEANRRNAAKSTGPKTKAGKARASSNAARHGLTIASLADPHWAPEVIDLVKLLVQDDAPVVLRECAYQFAAAQIDITRIKLARREIVNEAISDDAFEPRSRRMIREAVEGVKQRLAPASYDRLMAVLTRAHEGDEKAALVFSELTGKLLRLDRYERRARARRRSARRAFDRAARRLPGSLGVVREPVGNYFAQDES